MNSSNDRPDPVVRARVQRHWARFPTMAALLLLGPIVAGCWPQSSTSQPEPTASSGAVVARVNGVEIRESDLALAEDDIGNDLQAASPDAKREQLIAYVADVILVSNAARAEKLGDNPDFKQREQFLRNKLLMGLMLQSQGKTATTDEAMRKLYDEAVKPMGSEEEVHARHILVETEDEAKTILEQIKGGADFATLAKEKSKDPGAADGGDLGFFTKDQMVPAFSEVAFKMYPGQVSNPVRTQFGWHIIKVEERRPRQVPEFDKVKDQIGVYLARRAQTEYVAKLRQEAKIERLDKPAAAAPAPMMPAAPAAPANSMKK